MSKNLLYSLRDKTTEFFDKLIDDGSHSKDLRQEIINHFHQLYYQSLFLNNAESNIRWMGIPTEKCPLDLWIYQEIIFETLPDVIIECGTAKGGTALFLAHLCDSLRKGRVISVDRLADKSRPAHERITYLRGQTTSDDILRQVREALSPLDKIMVILDDDHHKMHVLKELFCYSELVTKGNYLVVEDTNLNGHPVYAEFGEGPSEAVMEFLKASNNFEPDKSREKLFLTFNPNGYLKRIK